MNRHWDSGVSSPWGVRGWHPPRGVFDEGPLCVRALPTRPPRLHVPSPHGYGACHYAIPVSKLARRRSPASWTWLRGGCPRGQSAVPHGWTGATELLAQDLTGAAMRQTDRHDGCRPCGHQPRERQPPGRPHLSRGDHLHCACDSMPMRRCHVLCLHGSSCSKWWLTLHEEDFLCIGCHARVLVCTQKQPFKRERCSLMDGHGWPRERPQ